MSNITNEREYMLCKEITEKWYLEVATVQDGGE